MIQVSRWCHVKNKKLLARAFFGSLAACALFTLSGIATAEIVIGRTLPLTGAFATYGTAKRDGADALIARINREGGVNGQLLRVETLDDTCLLYTSRCV